MCIQINQLIYESNIPPKKGAKWNNLVRAVIGPLPPCNEMSSKVHVDPHTLNTILSLPPTHLSN